MRFKWAIVCRSVCNSTARVCCTRSLHSSGPGRWARFSNRFWHSLMYFSLAAISVCNSTMLDAISFSFCRVSFCRCSSASLAKRVSAIRLRNASFTRWTCFETLSIAWLSKMSMNERNCFDSAIIFDVFCTRAWVNSSHSCCVVAMLRTRINCKYVPGWCIFNTVSESNYMTSVGCTFRLNSIVSKFDFKSKLTLSIWYEVSLRDNSQSNA